MGLIDRFQTYFKPKAEQDKPATRKYPPAQPFNLHKKFEVERDRKATIEDCRKMYKTDTRARQSIKTISRDATKGGFELIVEGARAGEAQAVADELIKRIKLPTRIDDWGRLTLRDGDSFLELIADAQARIVDVSRKPTLQMHRNSDEFYQFSDPMRAFYWVDDTWGVMDEPPADAVFFAEWQIIHARYDADEGSRYGEPVFSSARGSYKKMSEGEFDIAIRRKTRAGKKYVHNLKDASPADIERYKEANKDVINDPWAALADYYGSNIDIKSVDGDSNLGDITDILHHMETFAIASPVPLALIGYGENLNRDILEDKKAQYDDSIVAFREWIEDQIINPLLETQWLLQGIYPGALDWSIEWKAKETPTPVDVGDLAKSHDALKASGLFEDETLIRMFAGYVPSVDVDAVLASLAQRQAEQQAQADNAARITALAMNEPDNGDGNDNTQ